MHREIYIYVCVIIRALILLLKMINVINRNIVLCNYILNLYSKIVFNHLDNHEKLMFKKLETHSRKLITLELHLQFNIINIYMYLTCNNINLIYIYIYSK